MKLLDLAFTMAYDAKVNYEDVFSQVRMWDNYIYVELLKRKIAIPPKKESATKTEKYAGAYVKEPIPGMYDWVVSFDLNSLYPHLIMQYNISPETLQDTRHPSATVDKILDKQVDIDGQFAVCANGAQYRKDMHGFLPQMMQKMYDERVVFKKKMISKKNMKKIRPLNLPTKYPDVTTSRWLRRLVLIVLMALSVTSIFVITNSLTQKQSPCLDKSQSVG